MNARQTMYPSNGFEKKILLAGRESFDTSQSNLLLNVALVKGGRELKKPRMIL